MTPATPAILLFVAAHSFRTHWVLTPEQILMLHVGPELMCIAMAALMWPVWLDNVCEADIRRIFRQRFSCKSR